MAFASCLEHFNPRSREGSDFGDTATRPYLIISIHAPVKGATVERFDVQAADTISIHAPVKGATVR